VNVKTIFDMFISRRRLNAFGAVFHWQLPVARRFFFCFLSSHGKRAKKIEIISFIRVPYAQFLFETFAKLLKKNRPFAEWRGLLPSALSLRAFVSAKGKALAGTIQKGVSQRSQFNGVVPSNNLNLRNDYEPHLPHRYQSCIKFSPSRLGIS
jgi:hypothetical protein